ncbi:photosystem I protein PsaX [Microcoleus sp. FACHB-831]|jgi:photosystem I protein|nr:photosystem I protein PsaX [Microcoleus sp. FACHB-831]MBD1924144.1 photosystem I protein PsaX [Microcoleus sp. FACHB-831]
MSAAQAKKPTGSVPKTSNPPYPFRTIVLLILLAGNFLVAGIYFHLINP